MSRPLEDESLEAAAPLFHAGEAFPITPPSSRRRRVEMSVPASPSPVGGSFLSANDLEALAADVPSRMRTNLIGADLGQTELTPLSTAPRAWHEQPRVRETPPPEQRATTSDAPATSDSGVRPVSDSTDAPAPWDDWDMDDSQLYSDEQPVLSSDAALSSPPPPAKTALTAAQALTQWMEQAFDEQDALEGGEIGAAPLLERVGGQLVLRHEAIEQLYAAVKRCARDTDRFLSHGTLTPAAALPPRHMLEVDTSKLGRLLSLLEQTIRQWQPDQVAPSGADDDALCACIRASTAALLAVQCVLSILAYEPLPKFLFSEEVVEQCLRCARASMDSLLLPLVEACADVPGTTHTATVSSIATRLTRGAGVPRALDELLVAHFHHVCEVLVHLEKLFRMRAVALSETLLVSSVYLSLGTFFVQEVAAPGGGKGAPAPRAPGRSAKALFTHASVLRPLRLSSLNLLRSVFAYYPEQRHWVLGELLLSLLRLADTRQGKRHFRLPNGRTIFSATALLLQLLQAATQQSAADEVRTASWIESAGEDVGTDAGAAPPTQTRQESMYTLASTVAVYLVQRAAEAKPAKHAQELTYASAVYHLLEDLVVLVFQPEWPAAPLLLTCFCRIFVSLAEDPKSSLDAKAIALDHLGVTAARLRRCELELARALSSRRRKREPGLVAVQAMAQVVRDADTAALERLEQAHGAVLRRLHAAHEGDQFVASAAACHRLQFGYELVLAAGRTRDECERIAADDTSPEELARRQAFLRALAAAYQRLCAPEPVPAAASTQAGAINSQLVLHSSYMITYTALLTPLVHACGGHALATRSRALRGLGNIGAVDRHLLANASVREAVVIRLADSSANVRDTAVMILGAYALHERGALDDYWGMLAERAMDAATGVRKRLVRLLRSMYLATTRREAKIDAAVRILRCVHAEDPSLQTLALHTIEELWFPECLERSVDGTRRDGGLDLELEAPAAPVLEVALLLADVAARIRERPSPLDALLRQLGGERGTVQKDALVAKLGAMVDVLIGSLFADEHVGGAALLERIRVVHLLVATQPSVLTVGRAKQLLPYVAGAHTAEEVAVMEELLRVYRTCLPHMPRTATALGGALEKSLVPLVSKCTLAPGSPALQELIACFCTVIGCQTHHDALLWRTFHTCEQRLRDIGQLAMQGATMDATMYLVMCITALLCEHGRTASPPAPSDAECTSQVFAQLLALFHAPSASFHLPALTALGYLLRSHPSLFLASDLGETIDALLATGSLEERELVLHILLDLVQGEAAQSATPAGPEPKDMLQVLDGSATSLADTSVASALLQRYADPVLHASLQLQQPALQRTALEILTVSVLQGLCHPIQYMPFLIALETAEDATPRLRAMKLHMHLASKHATLLSARYAECARASFDFQKQQKLTSAPRGYRAEPKPTALLQTWYSLLRERRGPRNDFLKTLSRTMDLDLESCSCSEDHVHFALFVADNLALLEYKFAEEPLVVLRELELIQAVVGQQIAAHARRCLRCAERAANRELSPLTDESEESEADESEADESDEDFGGKRQIAGKRRHGTARRQPARRQTARRQPKRQRTRPTRPRQAGDSKREKVTPEAAVPGSSNPQADSSNLLALARAAMVMQITHKLHAHLKSLYRLTPKKRSQLEPRRHGSGTEHPTAPRPLAHPRDAALAMELEPPTSAQDAQEMLEAYVDLVEDLAADDSDDSDA